MQLQLNIALLFWALMADLEASILKMSKHLISMSGANAADACSCGESYPAGVKTKMYVAQSCEVDVFPTTIFEDTGVCTSMSDMVTLSGDITFDTAIGSGLGYFREFDIIDKSGRLTDTLVGDTGSKSFDNNVAFELAGTEAEQAGFAKLLANDCLIFIICTKAGSYRVIGSPDLPAKADSIVLDTGGAETDPNKGTYNLKSNTACPSFFYEGVIDITPNP